MNKNNKYLLLQTSIGDYRQSVVDKLQSNFGDNLTICCGDMYFDNTTFTRVKFPRPIVRLKNFYFLSQRVLFQYGANIQALFADNVILELNPRILNTWFIAILRRLMIKPVVMWGHAWPRNGKHSKSDIVRNLLRKIATHIIVYTDQQKNELLNSYPNLNIIVAPNSLYPESLMSYDNTSLRNDFIYVGRIVKAKKVELLIKSFISFISSTENTVSKLIIVGEGPNIEECKKILNVEKTLSDRVVFMGHVSDVEKLREYYSSAIASISPGYVGLSITQSFAFGVPMIIARDEPHSPEIEAANNGFNSFFFKSDSKTDLANKLNEIYQNRSQLRDKGSSIVETCKKTYSSDLMAKRLEMAFRLSPEYSPDNNKTMPSRILRSIVRSIRKCQLTIKMGKNFKYGKNCYWGKNVIIQAPDFFELGNNFSAGANLFVQTNLKTGASCLISSNVSFVGDDHYLQNETSSHYWSGKKIPSTIVLEGNNFIGFGATLVGNLNIGSNSIIGAGALVLKDVPPNVTVGGVPAKVIKHNSELKPDYL